MISRTAAGAIAGRGRAAASRSRAPLPAGEISWWTVAGIGRLRAAHCLGHGVVPGALRDRARAGMRHSRRPHGRSSLSCEIVLLEVVVGLLVGVDVLDGLVERLLRVGAVEDVLRGLGEWSR